MPITGIQMERKDFSDDFKLNNSKIHGQRFAGVYFSYSTCSMNKVFAWRLTPYSLNKGCICPYHI